MKVEGSQAMPSNNVVSVDFDPFAGGEIRRVAPVSESMREMWLSCAVGGEEASCAYNESFTLVLKGSPDPRHLRAALERLAAAHDCLRCCFSADGDSVCFPSSSAPRVREEDLAAADAAGMEARCAAVAAEEVRTPFVLTEAPLWRAVILAGRAELRLVFTAHHTICDGWSLDVLLSDLASLYSDPQAAPREGGGAFGDYLDAERAAADAAEHAESVAHWRAALEGRGAPLALPMEGGTADRRSYAAGWVERRLPAALPAEIRRLAASLGATPFSVMMAAYALLLRRVCGQRDIVIGTPLAGQALTGNRRLVGHCVTMAALPFAVDDDAEAGALIMAVQRRLEEAMRHPVTYGELLRTLRVPREAGRSPLISVCLTSSEKYASADLGFGTEYDYAFNHRAFETYDWYVNARTEGEGLTLLAYYNAARFSKEAMEARLAEQEQILLRMARDPSARTGDIEITTPDEEALYARWNDTDRPVPSCGAHALFERQAALTPDAPAIEDARGVASYDDLDARARAVAEALARRGLAPGSTVALVVDRSRDMVASLLGVLMAGSAYVPLDPSLPRERLRVILEDSRCGAMLAARDVMAAVPEALRPPVTLILEDLPARGGARSVDVDPRAAAYILFTSGSTGRPKGVEVSHGNLVNFLYGMLERPGMTARERMLAVTTLGFDIALSELLLPLVCGGAVTILPVEKAVDGQAVREILEQSALTALVATPVTWRLLLQAGWVGRPGFRVMSAGERMPADLACQLLGMGAEVWNLYGPTETTVYSLGYQVEHELQDVPLGKPMANTRIYVLDERGRRLPPTAWGELYIAGRGVATGYRGRPDLTAERFLPDPFWEGQRMYRTGDRCRFRMDGDVEYGGRLDYQVKIRGFRVELPEIESVLRTEPSVADAAVTFSDDGRGDALLCAYVVPAPGQEASAQRLRGFLMQRLPAYMVPTHYVPMPEFPLNANGKVDRGRLPPPQTRIRERDATFVPPAGETEGRLSAIFAEHLDVQSVGAEDNFFDMGANSLLLVRIREAVNRAFGADLPVVDFFGNPTVRLLARRLERDGRVDADGGATERARAQRDALAALRAGRRTGGAR
jgi:amino acid adenylation domain-containing protein